METSVRYIRIGGMKPALCFRGKTKAYGVINDELCIRAVEIPAKSHDLASNVFQRFFPYPPGVWATRLRELAARKGITRRALALLDLPEGAEEPDTLPPDEIAAPVVLARPGPVPKPTQAERRAPRGTDRPVTPSPVPKAIVSERGGLIAKLAAEFKIAPQQLRLSLRLAGLKAPYENEALIRSKIK